MNKQAIEFYAKKYFPHMRLDYAIRCVEAALKNPRKAAMAAMMAVGLTCTATAQTNSTPELPPVATNGLPSFFSDTINWIGSIPGTNWAVCVYGETSSGPLGNGGGIALAYELSPYIALASRVEYLNHDFYQGSMSVQLNVPIHLFGKVNVHPIVYGGAAVPFGGGASGQGGTVQGIAGTGLALELGFLGNWAKNIDLIATMEKWSATSGVQYRGGLVYKFW